MTKEQRQLQDLEKVKLLLSRYSGEVKTINGKNNKQSEYSKKNFWRQLE